MIGLRIRFGLRVRAERLSRGMTQQEFGEFLWGAGGSSRRRRVSEIEKGVADLRLGDVEYIGGKCGCVGIIELISLREVL
jgi:transcriptional regulator with XRE-family HTH domain